MEEDLGLQPSVRAKPQLWWSDTNREGRGWRSQSDLGVPDGLGVPQVTPGTHCPVWSLPSYLACGRALGQLMVALPCLSPAVPLS